MLSDSDALGLGLLIVSTGFVCCTGFIALFWLASLLEKASKSYIYLRITNSLRVHNGAAGKSNQTIKASIRRNRHG